MRRPGRIERARRLVRQKEIDVRQRLAGEHFVADEVAALVVAALAELERRRRRPCGPSTAAARRRRVVPARRERAAERGDAPRPDQVRPAVAADSAASARAAARRSRAGEHVEVLVVALDEVERRDRREILAVVARDVADADPQRHVGVPLHDDLNRLELAVDVAERADLHLSRSGGGLGWGRAAQPAATCRVPAGPAPDRRCRHEQVRVCPRRSRPCCRRRARSPCP